MAKETKNKNKFDFTYRDKALDLLEQLNNQDEALAEEERKIESEIEALNNQVQAIEELLKYITDVATIEKKMKEVDKLNNKIIALKHRESAVGLSTKNKYNSIVDKFNNLVKEGLTAEFNENIEVLRIELFSRLLDVLETVEDIKALGEDYTKASDRQIMASGIYLNHYYYPILATFGATNGIEYVPELRLGTLTIEQARYYLELVRS